MRGKLEQPKGLIELISVEVERIDPEYNELWLSFEYTCPGGEYKSAMVLPITNSRDMTNIFFRELIAEAKHLSEIEKNESLGIGLFVTNKTATALPIKNLCQRVIEVLETEENLSENREFIDLCTSGFHFTDPSKSLSSKDFEQRFKIFMSRVTDKMSQGFYTIAADDLEKANVLCSTSPRIYKLIGVCHRELGHLDLALEMFSKALEMGDTDKDTYLYLAEIHFFLNEMEQAAQVLKRLLKQYPDDIRALVEFANTRYQMDEEYVDILDKAYLIDADATQKTILQTFVFKKVGGGKKSRVSLERASALLDIPLQSMRLLAGNNRIPVRSHADNEDLILDEQELRSWAFVYRKYRLLEDEIERVSAHPPGDRYQGMALLP
ncbi:MAG TPA: tetratricopeptide repeat protein [Deltaproteobacteria bacterium]|nr:tetratricopeptide repeat protein [Deltaproteobacteria bacterium]